MDSTNSNHLPSSNQDLLQLQQEHQAQLAKLAHTHDLAMSKLRKRHQRPSNLQASSLSTGLNPILIPDSAAPPLLASTERRAPRSALGSVVPTTTLLSVVLPDHNETTRDHALFPMQSTLANRLPAPGTSMLTTMSLSQELSTLSAPLRS